MEKPSLEQIVRDIQSIEADATPATPPRRIGDRKHPAHDTFHMGLILKVSKDASRPDQRREHQEKLARLARALPAIGTRCRIEVPRFGIRTYDNDHFVAWYREIEGIKPCRDTLDFEQMFVALISTLHTTTETEQFPSKSIPWDVYAQKMLALAVGLEPSVREICQAEIPRLLREIISHDYQEPQVLIHGDLAFSNMRLGGNPRRITGIFDWDDAGMGDPAEDFQALLRVVGETRMRTAYQAYERRNEINFEDLLKRSQFLGIRAGLETGRASGFQMVKTCLQLDLC